MVNDFLQSGIIERFCLQEVTEAEKEYVEKMASHPAVYFAIESFKRSLAQTTAKPSPVLSKIKYKLMREVYKQCAETDTNFLPLVTKDFNTIYFQDFIDKNNLTAERDFDGNMEMLPLASTIEIQNAVVWIKGNFDEEMHVDEDEFIFVVKGSCIMNFDGVKTAYKEGDLIFIPPFVQHSAVVTSATPMFALVQRQLLPMA